MYACIFCHIVILIKTLTALYPLLNRFQVCPLLLKSYVKQNSCSYSFMYAQGGDFLPGASQQCRAAGWALTEALGWAAPLLFRGGVAEAGDCHCVPLAAQGVPTAPRAAFSCQCYKMGLCRGVHRNLKLCFNNRGSSLADSKSNLFCSLFT